MKIGRRDWLLSTAAGAIAAAGSAGGRALAEEAGAARKPPSGLRITGLRVTPVALPDPPLLAASGCHGPYFLRNVVEVETEAGVTGIGETVGGEKVTKGLEKCRALIAGQSAFSYRRFAPEALRLGRGVYAGLELACLDAVGRATGLRLCDLLGGAVREEVELSSYLFFRYAADDPRLLADPRIADDRGRGERALDRWGEVRTPEAMAELASEFHRRWGFRCHKLKAGVLPPDLELRALDAIHQRLGPGHLLRIDPNERWTVKTAVRAGEEMKRLPLEYYEDPVAGQDAMAEVRSRTGLPMSTNSCVTQFEHIAEAVVKKPVDVVLADHHYWGGIPACQALGTMAEALGWKLSQHSNSHAGVTMAAMVHLAAMVPRLTLASDTHYPWLVERWDIVAGAPFPIRGGRLAVPRSPGLGVDLDRDRVARAGEVYRKCGMRARDDAHTMRLVEPGWERKPY